MPAPNRALANFQPRTEPYAGRNRALAHFQPGTEPYAGRNRALAHFQPRLSPGGYGDVGAVPRSGDATRES